MIGNISDGTNCRHKLLLTNKQIINLSKSLTNNSSANIKLSKKTKHKFLKLCSQLEFLMDFLDH